MATAVTGGTSAAGGSAVAPVVHGAADPLKQPGESGQGSSQSASAAAGAKDKQKIGGTGKTCSLGDTCLKITALIGIVIAILAGVDGNWLACGVAGGVGLLALIPSVVAYRRSRASGAEKPTGGGGAKPTEDAGASGRSGGAGEKKGVPGAEGEGGSGGGAAPGGPKPPP